MKKNYSITEGPAAHRLRDTRDLLAAIFSSIFGTSRGSWYCAYCGTTHPRRRIRYAVHVLRDSIVVGMLHPGDPSAQTTVCHLGAEAIDRGTWPVPGSTSRQVSDLLKDYIERQLSTHDAVTPSFYMYLDRLQSLESRWLSFYLQSADKVGTQAFQDRCVIGLHNEISDNFTQDLVKEATLRIIQ